MTKLNLQKSISIQRGFTLIELLVSVAIFSVVMVIALGSLLVISESNRKAESLKSVVNNLNFSLDSMTRSMRTGINYTCSPSIPLAGTPPSADCTVSPGGSSVAFTDTSNRGVVYKFESSNASLCNQTGIVGCITRSVDGGATFSPLTAPEVRVTSLSFYVIGSSISDQLQPKISIVVSGTMQVTSTLTSQFNLQTSVTQRLYDQ